MRLNLKKLQTKADLEHKIILPGGTVKEKEKISPIFSYYTTDCTLGEAHESYFKLIQKAALLVDLPLGSIQKAVRVIEEYMTVKKRSVHLAS